MLKASSGTILFRILTQRTPPYEKYYVIVNLPLEAPKPTQNPEIPPKHRVYANFFERFARTFAFFPVTQVRNPTKIVQKNLFRWTFLFWVDFFGWIFLLWTMHSQSSIALWFAMATSLCGHRFPWEFKACLLWKKGSSVVNLGCVVKTLRHSNSLSRSALSMAGSFGHTLKNYYYDRSF